MAGFHVGFTVPVQVLQDAQGRRTVTIGRVLEDGEPRDFATVEGACADLAERIRAQLAKVSP